MDCHYLVRKTWNFFFKTSPMHAFAHLIARTRSRLIRWRCACMNSEDHDIREIELTIKLLELVNSETSISNSHSNSLMILYNKYNALLHQNYLK